MEKRFEGNAVIVTGSSSGIGKATALRMAREGSAVCVVANRNVEGGNATVREIIDGGGRAVFVQADVSASEDCRRAVDATLDRFGRIDALVNNAGITRRAPLLETTEQLWDTVLGTNLKSVYLMSKFALPDMLERGAGSIVNIASVHADQTHDGFGAYAASKAGMCGLTRAMALEFAPKGIRVNCLLPGTIDTRLYPRRNTPVDRQTWQPRASDAQPSGRFGSPDEIAGAICFLASEDASYVNGAALVVDGGLLCFLGDGL